MIRKLGDDALLHLISEEPENPIAKDAISELFRRYQERVYHWCFRYARDHDKAMDLSQDVFFGAYQNLKSFGGRASFSSWLFAIARNRCVSAMRKMSPLENADGDPDLVKDLRCGPDDAIENEQEQEAMLELMRKTLEPTEQEAICLQIFERLPVDSITEVLGITGSTGARSVLQSARRKLRAALGEQSESQGESDHD
jgi:RNA polymerase sigma-70 factor (ECF subfamily)